MANNLFSLEGKNAWITGASYGIGFNIAMAFVAAGVKNIIFNDINEEPSNVVWITTLQRESRTCMAMYVT